MSNSSVIGALRVDLSADSAEFERGLDRARGKLSQTDKAFADFSRSASRALGGLTVGYLVRETVQLADAYTNMTNRLRFVTQSSAELEAVQLRLFQIAQGSRQGLAETGELYARMAFALKDTGASQAQVLQFTENLNKALTLSGSAGAEASGALIQLSQGLAAGTLRGQELNSVMEQTPYVASLIAKQLGVTTGELRKLGFEGKITGEQVFKALLNATDELDGKFDTTVPTIQQGLTVLNNSLLNFVGRLNTATGASQALANVLITIAGVLDRIDASKFFAGAGEGAAAGVMAAMKDIDPLQFGWDTTFTPNLENTFDIISKEAALTGDALQEAKRALDNFLSTDTTPFADRYAAIQKALQDQIITTEQAARMTRRAKEQESDAWLNLASSAASALTTIFEDNKAAAIASAIINTLVGVTKAFAELPFPLNWAQAALVSATGFAQVQKIRSTSKNATGGSASVASGGTSAVAQSAAQTEDAPAKSTSIFVQGVGPNQLFRGESLLAFIDAVKEYQRDGGELIVKGV